MVDRSILLSAIQAADAVAPATSTKPIVTNLLIRAVATTREVEIVATDLNVGLRCIVPGADVRTAGEVVIGARQITAILKESTSPSVTVRLVRSGEQHLVEVALADGDYQIQAMVGEAFPEVQRFPEQATGITVPGARLQDMLRTTTFAMDKDKGSPVLSGLLAQVTEGEFILAATDGKVLAEAVDRSERYQPSEALRPMVIPAPTVSHLARILGGEVPAKVTLAPLGKVLFARLDQADGLRIELTSRLIEGAFPTYRPAIAPTPGAATATFATADLASAVRRTALMTNATARGIIMSLERGRAVFSNLNYSNGSARIPLACTYAGGPMRQGFSSQYVIDVLRAFTKPEIEIEFGRGMIMRQPGSTFLVMPITLPS